LDLKALRTKIALKENVPAFVIFSDATLLELATYLPQDMGEIRRISGFGEIKSEKYGRGFLEIILDYCQQHQLSSRISDKKPKRQRREVRERATDTKLVSFDLYKKGLTIAEIATRRELAEQTIAGHLAYFILEGSISVTDFVPETKIPAIVDAIRIHGDAALTPIKLALGDGYSFSEIKAVVCELKRRMKHP
jgi:ATP-dependent DNA helicase RecQ